VSSPKAPPHLSEASRATWRRLQRDYSFETHHLAILTATLEAQDRYDQARQAITAEGLIVPGREGLTRLHPAVSVERDSRIAVIRGYRELGLDLPEAPARPGARPALRAMR
jgi:P27 family predicted phage terminase small subunit